MFPGKERDFEGFHPVVFGLEGTKNSDRIISNPFLSLSQKQISDKYRAIKEKTQKLIKTINIDGKLQPNIDFLNQRGLSDTTAGILATLLDSNINLVQDNQEINHIKKGLINFVSQYILHWNNEAPEGLIVHSGTEANLEALRIGRDITKRRSVLLSPFSHSSNKNGAQMLDLKILIGKNKKELLNHICNNNDIGTLVITQCTTSFGSDEVDQYLLNEHPEHNTIYSDIVHECHKRGIRIHIDAAYGGFIKGLYWKKKNTLKPLQNIIDSITIDPHKFITPYGMGMLLFANNGNNTNIKKQGNADYFKGNNSYLGTSRSAKPLIQAAIQIQQIGYEGLQKLAYRIIQQAQNIASRFESKGYTILGGKENIDSGIIPIGSADESEANYIIHQLEEYGFNVAKINEPGNICGRRTTITPNTECFDPTIWNKFFSII